MFKPEYIRDNMDAFGYADTLKIITNKFQRMGKNANIARIMAIRLIDATMENGANW